MINQIIETEIMYKRCFCSVDEFDCFFRFTDKRLLDMRAHNLIVFKPQISEEDKAIIIEEEIEKRKSQGFDFLLVISFEPINEEVLEKLSEKAEREVYDFMMIKTDKANEMKTIDKIAIKLADSDQLFLDGRYVDIEANKKAMTEDFATRRIDRKLEAYKDDKIPLNLLVSYLDDIPVGNSEMFLNEGLAKIEDFDILENYQRRGIGTHFMRSMLERVSEHKIKNAYVVTDHEDTAKEMYSKLGFEYITSATELLFNF